MYVYVPYIRYAGYTDIIMSINMNIHSMESTITFDREKGVGVEISKK